MISSAALLGSRPKGRTPSLSALVMFCTVGALWLGFIAVLGFRNSTADVVAIAASLMAFSFLMGACLFLSLARALAYGRVLVEREGLRAEGVGRIGGRLTGLVVIATNQRVIAIPGRLFQRPKVSVSIPYGEILNYNANDHFLYVQSQTAEISLIKCAPDQVAKLANELKQRVPR